MRNKRLVLAATVLLVSVLATVAVVVLSDSLSGGAAVTDCAGRSADDYGCFTKRYRELTESAGIEPAFRSLKRESDENPFVRAVCHTLTHEIGRTAAARHGSVADTYARGDTFCGSGYFHGAMETIVADIGAERALKGAATLCGDAEGQAYHRNCVHGLGHGFMVVQQNDVFESLPACDRLRARWEKRNCYDGVFMQNIMSRNAAHYPAKHLRSDEPMYPCTAVKVRYKDRCYERQTVQALLTQDGDFDRVFGLCADVEADFRDDCHLGLGRDAAGQAIDNNEGAAAQAAQTVVLCHMGDDADARETCIVGAAQFLLRQSETDRQARELCRAVEGRLRARCVGALRPAA